MAVYTVERASEAVGGCRLKCPGETIDELRAFATGDAEVSHGALWEAARVVEHLRTQHDDLQRSNTALVMANRDLKAQIAGHPVVRIKRVGAADLPLPRYETEGAAGMDLRADVLATPAPLPMDVERIGEMLRLHTGARISIPCGFAFEIPEGWEGQVRPRSGWKKRRIDTMFGTIDCDFRGAVCATIQNNSAEPIEIRQGDRMAQLIIARAPQARLEEVEELSQTSRGANGFGSTGVR